MPCVYKLNYRVRLLYKGLTLLFLPSARFPFMLNKHIWPIKSSTHIAHANTRTHCQKERKRML